MCLCEGRQSMRGPVALLLLAVVASCGKNGSPDPSVPRRVTGEGSVPVVYVVVTKPDGLPIAMFRPQSPRTFLARSP